MTSSPVHIFTPEEYEGELNLNALERRIVVRELQRTQRLTSAAVLLRFSERSMDRKIKAHQIKDSEWKKPKIKKTNKY